MTRKEFYRHTQARKLNEDDENYVKELFQSKANHNNIAACLSRRTGKDFSRKDINNLVKKLGEKETNVPLVEEVLGGI